MKPTISISLIGDFNPEVPAHRAIPLALDRAFLAAAAKIAPR